MFTDQEKDSLTYMNFLLGTASNCSIHPFMLVAHQRRAIRGIPMNSFPPSSNIKGPAALSNAASLTRLINDEFPRAEQELNHVRAPLMSPVPPLYVKSSLRRSTTVSANTTNMEGRC